MCKKWLRFTNWSGRIHLFSLIVCKWIVIKTKYFPENSIYKFIDIVFDAYDNNNLIVVNWFSADLTVKKSE